MFYAVYDLDQSMVSQAAAYMSTGATAEEIAPLCGNLFELAVDLDEVAAIRKSMLEHDALCSVMTGSGAAVFGLFPTRAAAEQACTALKKLVPFAEVCHTL